MIPLGADPQALAQALLCLHRHLTLEAGHQARH